MAAKMLHDCWGCRVLIATTLEQVRTIIAQKKHNFFVAVSDLNLPDAPDGEVIDELIGARIPVINNLTGLFNRRYFFEQGGRLHAEAIKVGKPLVAAVVDIDFFKKINDTYGHGCGDVVLKHISALLDEHFRNDLVARIGGEEFALLFSAAC